MTENIGTSAHLREETVVYSLPIVVRVEKDTAFENVDFYQAIAQGIAILVTTDKWSESVKKWMQGRFRKVIRKARGSTWDKALSLDHIEVNLFNGLSVAIFEPTQPELLAPELKKLQVQGIDFANNDVSTGGPDQTGILISINPDLKMSSGKMGAQVAHAVQLLFMGSTKEQVTEWMLQGSGLRIVPWDEIVNGVEIVDAGLTEIPAGSLTVKAKWS